MTYGYGITVTKVSRLDVGVFRFERGDKGPALDSLRRDNEAKARHLLDM